MNPALITISPWKNATLILKRTINNFCFYYRSIIFQCHTRASCVTLKNDIVIKKATILSHCKQLLVKPDASFYCSIISPSCLFPWQPHASTRSKGSPLSPQHQLWCHNLKIDTTCNRPSSNVMITQSNMPDMMILHVILQKGLMISKNCHTLCLCGCGYGDCCYA